MNLNCKSKNLSKKEQYLCKIKPLIDNKYNDQIFSMSYRQACNVFERLEKSTFLALLGNKSYCKIEYLGNYIGTYDFDKIKLKCNKNKENSCCGNIENPLYFCCETIYSNTRNYFENLTIPWTITSFDSKNRKVCIEIKSKFGNRNLMVTLPEQK